MRPMSEDQEIDVNSTNCQLNSDVIKTEDADTDGQNDDELTNTAEDAEHSRNENNVEIVTNDEKDPSLDQEEPVENGDRQDSVESVKNQLSTEEIERQGSVDNKDRQSSVESKSHPSTWSFSQWSENYESLDDERPVEDLDGDPQKLILWAAEKNELETMRRLLEEDPSLVNAKDNDLYTPLHRACYSNNVEVIKLLLSYDANISSKTADGWEALHCACKWDSVEAVSLLLQNGADVNAQTKGHITPLHLAASNIAGRRTLELLLWQQYVDTNIKNDAGDTAYDIACRTGPLGALFEILEESVNVY